MRGLSGDFSTMPTKDLVSYLGNRRVSGMLRLHRGTVRKVVQLRDGHVVSASSNQPRELLGRFLINMGNLTEDQLVKAFATRRETNVPLGRILVMVGLVAEQTVYSALQLKFREALLDAFAWVEGEFTFDPTELPTVQDGVDARVDLLEVYQEGEFRETAWQAMRAVFPSGRVRLAVEEQRLEAPAPGSLDAKLVSLIREGFTINEMAQALHTTDFLMHQRLYALYRREAVKVLEEAPLDAASPDDEDAQVVDTNVLGTETSVAEVLQAARAFLEVGNFRDGEALARRAHEMAPSTETEEMLRSAEAALLGALRRELVESPQVPVLQVAALDIKRLPLSAPERYLLSRVDGRRDLLAIVRMSPLPELEALKYLRGFVDRGLVKLGSRSATSSTS